MKGLRTIVILLVISCVLISFNLRAQKFKSVSSTVHFYSDAPMEDIEATNPDGKSALDISSGQIVFSIPIKSFSFEKSLMQEHFNENYLESDKYPEATFNGKLSEFDPAISGWQSAKATGVMNLHGMTQNLSVDGEIKIDEEKIEIKAKFPITLKDYKIKIPKVVFYNIAEVVDVTITFKYEKID
jgi:polyisoprenoid-binding protein YceI